MCPKNSLSDEERIRLEKLKRIKEAGINPYPEKFSKTHSLEEAKKLKLGAKVKVAGRLMTIRDMGKLCFCHLQDFSGKMQIALKADEVGKENYKFFVKNFDMGDFVGVEGEVFKTHKGEISVLVKKYTFLSKALKPLPEKWHGVADQELKYRKRYLDLIMNRDTIDLFLFRSKFIKLLREFYWSKDFIEIETPVLSSTASGALAKPFKTHHNALDRDFYLRIAIETLQKEAIVGGFEKVFEIGKVFRNEGMDPSHLQEFTMCEHYVSYWNYEDNIRFTEEMFNFLLKKLIGTTKLEVINRDGKKVKVDFKPPFKVVTFKELIKKDCGIDIDNFEKVEDLRKEIKKKKIDIEDISKLGRGNLIDELYKKVSRPKLVGPVFLTKHPTDVSPLARKNDDNPKVVDRFQLVVVGWEIVNAYSELVDPIDQEKRFEQQAKSKKAGDVEAHGKDIEYVEAMKHGMPPISGWGMGIDRIVALLTQQDNLRDVVLFPLMRPGYKSEIHKSKDTNIAVAIVNKGLKLKKWEEMNTIAHLNAAFGARKGKELLMQDIIKTKDNEDINLNIQHAIMIKTAKSNKEILDLVKLSKELDLDVAEFTKEMIETTDDKKVIKQTKKKKMNDIGYLGVLVFGKKSIVDKITKKFGLLE